MERRPKRNFLEQTSLKLLSLFNVISNEDFDPILLILFFNKTENCTDFLIIFEPTSTACYYNALNVGKLVHHIEIVTIVSVYFKKSNIL